MLSLISRVDGCQTKCGQWIKSKLSCMNTKRKRAALEKSIFEKGITVACTRHQQIWV